MRQIFLTMTMLLLAFTVLFGQTPSPSKDKATNAPEQEVTKADGEYRIARLNRDMPTLKRLVADDYLSISDGGQVVDRTTGLEFMAKASTGELQYDEVKVRTYGETAVITGRITNEENQQSRFTRIWVKRQGQWQLASAHISRVTG